MDQLARTSTQLGAALRRARKRLGLSQEAVAAKVSLRQATISRLESGDPGVKLGTLLAVLAALEEELVVRPRRKGGAEEIEEHF